MYRRRALQLGVGAAGTLLAGCAAPFDSDDGVSADAHRATGSVRGGLFAADFHGDDAAHLQLLATTEAFERTSLAFDGAAAAFVEGVDFDEQALLVCQYALPGGSRLGVTDAGRVADRHLRVGVDCERGDGSAGTVHTLLVRLGLRAGQLANVRRVDVTGAGHDLDVYNVWAEPLPGE